MATGRVGYEYHYRFSIEDDLLSLYEFEMFTRSKTYLFEIRTNFVVKKTDGEDQIMESERFGALEYHNTESGLKIKVVYRLKEYWMTKDEVNKLVHEAFEFARKIADDPRHASRLVIPVLVSLEVRTVQQEGEPVDSVINRAIRAEKLVPLYLWPLATPPVHHPKFPCFLMELPTNRVEDIEQGLKIMRACDICLRAPTIGAQITVLPSCGHAFHLHCIVRWLMGNNLCPSCNSPAYDGDMLDSPYEQFT